MTATRRLVDALRNPTAIRVIKLALTVLVLVALVRYVARTWSDLDTNHVAPTFHWGYLCLAGGLYLAGLYAQGIYFGLVLNQDTAILNGVQLTPASPGYPAVRAYLISHLAKYVPGKAMVVVVRSGLCAEAGIRPATAAFATLYETIAMMAVGGLVAAAGLWLSPSHAVEVAYDGPSPFRFDVVGSIRLLAWPALGAGLGLLILVWPTIFPKIAGLIRRPLRGVGEGAVPRLSGGLLFMGFFLSTIGWVPLGLSLLALINGIEIPGPYRWEFDIRDSSLVVASVALATVAGFVVPIAPGGLGVREWVLWTTLGAIMPHDRAVVSATLLRLVWVAAEVVAAAVLLPIRPKARPAA